MAGQTTKCTKSVLMIEGKLKDRDKTQRRRIKEKQPSNPTRSKRRAKFCEDGAGAADGRSRPVYDKSFDTARITDASPTLHPRALTAFPLFGEGAVIGMVISPRRGKVQGRHGNVAWGDCAPRRSACLECSPGPRTAP